MNKLCPLLLAAAQCFMFVCFFNGKEDIYSLVHMFYISIKERQKENILSVNCVF